MADKSKDSTLTFTVGELRFFPGVGDGAFARAVEAKLERVLRREYGGAASRTRRDG